MNITRRPKRTRTLAALLVLAFTAFSALTVTVTSHAQQATLPADLMDDDAPGKGPAKKQPPAKDPGRETNASIPEAQPKAKPAVRKKTPPPAPAPAASPAPAKAAPALDDSGYTVDYAEYFTNPATPWPQQDGKELSVSKKSNSYYILSRTPEKSWTIRLDINFNPDKDFILEAKFNHISGAEKQGYGLLWGFGSESDTYYKFLIAPIGYYSASKVGGGQSTYMVKWTQSPLLVKGSGSVNTISINRVGSEVRLFINGKFAASFPYERPVHKKCGFLVSGLQEISVDYIMLKSRNR